jgi:hypothetical protein
MMLIWPHLTRRYTECTFLSIAWKWQSEGCVEPSLAVVTDAEAIMAIRNCSVIGSITGQFAEAGYLFQSAISGGFVRGSSATIFWTVRGTTGLFLGLDPLGLEWKLGGVDAYFRAVGIPAEHVQAMREILLRWKP